MANIPSKVAQRITSGLRKYPMCKQRVRRQAAVFLTGILALATSVGTTNAQAQAIQEVITPDMEISEGYDTWSLFLICNDSWRRPDSPDQLRTLWREFTSFGHTIGRNHLAVWFWKRRPRWGTDSVYLDVDVERASTYCDTYDLLPSRSPHVLVLTEYPNIDKRAEWYHKIELAGTPLDEIEGFLNEVADVLVAGNVHDLSPETDSFWFAFFDALREPIKRLGSNVKATIKTPFLNLELTGGDRP